MEKFVNRGYVGSDELTGMRKFMMGLDGTTIPSDLYKNVIRLQVNTRVEESLPFSFVPPNLFQLSDSMIKESEDVLHVKDKGWRMEVGVEWLKGYLCSSNMPFDSGVWTSDGWQELERIVYNELGGNVVIEWPVAMIMASKR